MDDKLLLYPSHQKIPELIIIERNKPWKKSARWSFMTTVATICFAAFLGLMGIYVAWVKPSCWWMSDSNTTNTDQYPVFNNPECSNLPPQINRFDCWPEYKDATRDKCEVRGCCWAPVSDVRRFGDVPWCFYPTNYQLYTVQDIQKSSTGMKVQLTSATSSGWPNDIQQLVLDIVYETTTRLHFKIYDANNRRYEVPVNVSRVEKPVTVSETDYMIEVPSQGPFYITVTRKSTGKILFSSKSVAPLVFADQFIQFGTQLSSQFIYGLGEHMDKFALDTKWKKMVLWARDQPPVKNGNLYGSHPFYLNIEEDHNAHGVFLLNSNAMEVDLQEMPALTYRTTGGILDFYILTGPSPDSVVEQYTGLVGRSFMPPYWALGFHLCRWGYGSSEEVKTVIKRMRDAKMPYIELQESPSLTYRTTGGILDFYILTGSTPDNVVEQYSSLVGRSFMPPYWALGFHLCKYGYGSSNEVKRVIERMRDAKMPYDTQWTDIDYMRSHLDWTYDAEGHYPELPDIVKDLHDNGQHYIPIVDPGISNSQKAGRYPPFDDGLKQDIFVKKYDESGPVIGRVWPGTTAFPDFFHPNATQYWTTQAKNFYDQIKFDGLWIDMNEPSDFADGSTDGCPSTSLENPPFVPVGLIGGDLKSRTICPSSKHYFTTHYNLHSLYGHSEAIATKSALDTILGNKRSIVISRSTFPTTGVHAGHWLGDNNAEWDHTYYSITGMLSFQLFGIPLVGADICGFGGNTTPELCTRWMQLGAFYPFMRNHNSIGNKDQDPAVFDEDTQNIMRTALETRYTLLPYLYTLFYRTHVNGTAIVRPLFFQYPESEDNVVYNEDVQFLWGTSLLITPVTSEKTTTGQGYLPKDRWYDYYAYTYVDSPGHFVMFDLPMEHINIQVRGGSVIPMQFPAVTTTLARKNKFKLLVALSPESTASGEIYWDDGESRDSISSGKYNLISFQSSERTLTSSVLMSGYTEEPMMLGAVRIMGIEIIPTGVTVNGGVTGSYTYQDKSLYIYDQNLDLLKPFSISWLV